MNYFNPIAGVVNLREKCLDLVHACDYSEPYSISWQAMVHLICNVKQNDCQTKIFLSKLSTLVLCTNRMRLFGYVVCSDGNIAQVRKLHRRDNAGQRKLRLNYFEMAERNLELI